jgi:hypothetical protein
MHNSLLVSTVLTFAATNVSEAALVSISQIVTNNTLTTQTYDFSAWSGMGSSTTPAHMRGSISITLSDFNRNGATISSDGLYLAQVNSAVVKTMPSTPFTLTAPARGGNSYTNSFGWEYLTSSLSSSDSIELRLNFRLTPGDQVAIAGTFEVASVPAPASFMLIGCAGIAALFGKRNK